MKALICATQLQQTENIWHVMKEKTATKKIRDYLAARVLKRGIFSQSCVIKCSNQSPHFLDVYRLLLKEDRALHFGKHDPSIHSLPFIYIRVMVGLKPIQLPWVDRQGTPWTGRLDTANHRSQEETESSELQESCRSRRLWLKPANWQGSSPGFQPLSDLWHHSHLSEGLQYHSHPQKDLYRQPQ